MLKLKDLLIRSISGLVLVVLLISATFLSDISKFVILAVIGILSLREMTGVLCPENVKSLKKVTLILALVFIGLFFIVSRDIVCEPLLKCAAVVIVMIRLIAEMVRRNENPIINISYDIFAIIYTVVPMMLLSTLPSSIIVSLFVIVWVNDIGAYLVGMMFGRHRLWVRLSPKKSWEGFFGGVIFALGVSVIISHSCQIHDSANTLVWILAAGVVAVSGVMGDLFESMLKRSAGVKDSGKIIPGHGGMLDRFDAMLFAAPVMWIIYNLV